MRLESVLAVTGGRLLNSPFISGFDTVALSAKKVQRGSLFVAYDEHDIETAVERGAYGIVTDSDHTPTDEEIAWIRVDTLTTALPKLLRLWLVENPRKIYFVPSPVLEYIDKIVHNHDVVVLGRKEKSEQLFASSPLQTILCDDAQFLERIGHPVITIESEPVESRVVTSTVFETSLILEGKFYRDLSLPPCMLPQFLNAVGILKHLSLDFSLGKLAYTPSFEPVFVDAYGKETPFGSGVHVLVFIDRLSSDCRCVQMINSAAWIARKICLPRQIKFECDIKMPIHRYHSSKELFSIIRNDFAKPGYTVIVGMGRNAFYEAFNMGSGPSETQHSKGFDFNE